MVRAHIGQLRSLQAAITSIEHLIATRVAACPRTRLLARLPGAGTINLAQLLAEVGPILDRAAAAEQAASACGTAPVTRACGKRNPHATRIVARAWIRVIWACWHTGTPYDPAAHRTARQPLTRLRT